MKAYTHCIRCGREIDIRAYKYRYCSPCRREYGEEQKADMRDFDLGYYPKKGRDLVSERLAYGFDLMFGSEKENE